MLWDNLFYLLIAVSLNKGIDREIDLTNILETVKTYSNANLCDM